MITELESLPPGEYGEHRWRVVIDGKTYIVEADFWELYNLHWPPAPKDLAQFFAEKCREIDARAILTPAP